MPSVTALKQSNRHGRLALSIRGFTGSFLKRYAIVEVLVRSQFFCHSRLQNVESGLHLGKVN